MTKPLIAALATAAALLAAGAAHAGGNVQWSVGVNLPNVATVVSNFPFPVLPQIVVQQAPVYAPPPVVYEPAPRVVYAPPPVVYEPAPRVVYQQRPVVVYQEPVVVGRPVPVVYERGWDRDHDGIPDRYDRHDNRRDNRWHPERAWGDRDHDGVPNRYDRVDNRQFIDRDRDGVADRVEARDDRKSRH